MRFGGPFGVRPYKQEVGGSIPSPPIREMPAGGQASEAHPLPSQALDRCSRDRQVDPRALGIHGRHLVELHDVPASPEQEATLDHDLIRMIRVPLVADVLDLAHVPSVQCDHAEPLGGGQGRSEPDDVFALALRVTPFPRSGRKTIGAAQAEVSFLRYLV
jgi:hypothetical protein